MNDSYSNQSDIFFYTKPTKPKVFHQKVWQEAAREIWKWLCNISKLKSNNTKIERKELRPKTQKYILLGKCIMNSFVFNCNFFK